jgi:hypothetical protein
MAVEYLSEKTPGLEMDEKRIAAMRVRRARKGRPAEMRFRPVRIKEN